MDIQTAVRTVLRQKYATFTGRAQRSEFWWFVLFNFIVAAILSILDGFLFGYNEMTGQPNSLFGLIYSLAVIIPSIAVSIRRLHDTGRSGWWLLIVLVPVIGALVLIYFYIKKGTDGDNQFGPDPLR